MPESSEHDASRAQELCQLLGDGAVAIACASSRRRCGRRARGRGRGAGAGRGRGRRGRGRGAASSHARLQPADLAKLGQPSLESGACCAKNVLRYGDGLACRRAFP